MISKCIVKTLNYLQCNSKMITNYLVLAAMKQNTNSFYCIINSIICKPIVRARYSYYTSNSRPTISISFVIFYYDLSFFVFSLYNFVIKSFHKLLQIYPRLRTMFGCSFISGLENYRILLKSMHKTLFNL